MTHPLASLWGGGLLLAIAAGGALAWRLRGRDTLERLSVSVLPLAWLVVAAAALVEIARAPHAVADQWMLTPAIALTRGYALYAPPDDGPIVTSMYGPVASLVGAPAGLVPSPTPALWLAAVLRLLLFFAPVAWLHLALRGSASRWRAGIWFTAFCLLALTDPALGYSAVHGSADAPALGLSAAACALLLTRSAARGARDPRLWLSAACAVLAVWSKQTAAPGVAALPLYLLLTEGARGALRYCALLGLLGLAATLAFAAAFGAAELVFHLLTLPSRIPWYEQETRGRWETAAVSFSLLIGRAAWPAAWIALLAFARRRGGGLRAWLRAEPWSLLVLVGLCALPGAVLTRAKLGGYVNAASLFSYFLWAAATAGSARGEAEPPPWARRAVAVVAPLLVCGLVVGFLADPRSHRRLAVADSRVREWRSNALEQAFRFAARHPGEVYFPDSPIVSLFAEGKLYHGTVGIWDRVAAGYPPSARHYRAHLPPRLRLVARQTRSERPPVLPRFDEQWLPEFHQPTTVPGLEAWTVLGRAGQP